jgi:hypothetical protein
MLEIFEGYLNSHERDFFLGLDAPAKIQAFLDEVQYPATDRNRRPLNMLRDRQGHCLDGALFAATALRRLGFPPLLVDIFPEPGLDDDHVLAIYKVNGCFGALAKSNFVTLRSRQPVYRSLRELVMSYFDGYFNVNGVRSLRSYTLPLHLETYDATGWMWDDTGADAVERSLLKLQRIPLITPAMAERLDNADPLTYRAGTLATNPEGLYKPGLYKPELSKPKK